MFNYRIKLVFADEWRTRNRLGVTRFGVATRSHTPATRNRSPACGLPYLVATSAIALDLMSRMEQALRPGHSQPDSAYYYPVTCTVRRFAAVAESAPRASRACVRQRMPPLFPDESEVNFD